MKVLHDVIGVASRSFYIGRDLVISSISTTGAYISATLTVLGLNVIGNMTITGTTQISNGMHGTTLDPVSVTTNYNLKLPATLGSVGDFLELGASGQLTFAPVPPPPPTDPLSSHLMQAVNINADLTIPAGYQYIVYGNLNVGPGVTLDIQGDLVIL